MTDKRVCEDLGKMAIEVLAKADPFGQRAPEGGQQGGACPGENHGNMTREEPMVMPVDGPMIESQSVGPSTFELLS